MKYNIVYEDGDPTSVTVFTEQGSTFTADSGHRNFQEIVERIKDAESESEIETLFDLSTVLDKEFSRIGERVLVRSGELLFDGESVDSSVASLAVRFHEQGNTDKLEAIVAFMEKLAQNPSENSRKQLYNWLTANNFSITDDGDIIAYKGVRLTGNGFQSSSKGTAIVNGVWHRGNIPNTPGTIIEMPRGDVVDDPHNPCSTGLHVGDWSYASGFASITLLVKVNPRDVVSVPNDANHRKVRCCRYKVIGPVTERDHSAYISLNDERLVAPALEPTSTAMSEEKRRFYEQFKKGDFEERTRDELRWLVREWGVKTKGSRKADLVESLYRAASNRRRASKDKATPVKEGSK